MRLEADCLTLSLEISRTAHLFHVVDQLSAWSEFTHAQYRRWFEPLSSADHACLDEHKAIRRRRGWSGGLEQSFYTAAELDEALHGAAGSGLLSDVEAATERRVFLHFADRVDGLLSGEIQVLERFCQTVTSDVPRLAGFAARISRVCECQTISVPGFLIANPSDMDWGGGFNGGRLTLEVARKADMYPVLLHELMHAFLALSGVADRLQAVASTIGCDAETLNEGLAYALSPGIFSARGDVDELQRDVAADRAAGKSFQDSYTRFRRFGLTLRPFLRAAIDSEQLTIGSVLARAPEAWRNAKGETF